MTILYSDYFPQKTIKTFNLLPSTNDFVSNWCQSSEIPPEGSLVIAEKQSAGKGQTGNTWESAVGLSLTFSMIYYPDFLPLDRLFALNMITSLAVWESLAHLAIDNLSVKWPNDVLIDQKKVAGILIRNSLSGKKLANSIIGIGLNVNQTNFPEGLPNATSLQLSTGKVLDKNEILNRIVRRFEENYIALKAGQYEALKNNYLRLLFRMGKHSSFFRKDGSTFTGKIIGIKDSGHLLIDNQGQIEAYDFQTIKFAG